MQLDAIDEADEVGDNQDDQMIVRSTNKPAIFKHKEIVDVTQAKKDIEVAIEEWDQLEPPKQGIRPNDVQTALISYDEVLDYFRQKDMEQYLEKIIPLKLRKGFEAFKYWIIGPPKLDPRLISDRNLFFAIALCPLDSTEEAQSRVLQTLQKTLTATDKDLPRYGAHWEDLGFQGVDPATDLRGVGFLGLFHLLCLVINPATTNLAKDIYSLSRTEKQNFPFCTMGINFSRIVLETMREEALNRECNKKMNIFEVTNNLYAGVFLRFFVTWRDQNKTIMDSGHVIKSLTAFTKKHSSVILKELDEYVKAT